MRPLRSAACTLIFVLGAACAPLAAAQVVTSSLMLPVDGLVFAPGQGYENVVLTGRVHVVTQVASGQTCIPTDPCRTFIDLADVKGVGLSSAGTYIAIGAANASCAAGVPCAAVFTIMPVAIPPSPVIPPSPIMPITFAVNLGFDQTGHLSASGTSVHLPPATCSPTIDC